MTAWMTWEQAFRYAYEASKATQRRYRVFKSRDLVPWWQVRQISDY